MLVIEEMRSADKNEWALQSSALKTLITEPEITIREKHVQQQVVKNHLNIIINTNKNAIKLEGMDRRYLVADVSDIRIGDLEYFDKLHKYLDSDEVALGFYRYCHENIDDSFDLRRIPETTNKQEGIIESLNPIIVFIKDRYLLRKEDLTCKFSEFYREYTSRYSSNGIRIPSKVHVSKILRENWIKTKQKAARALYLDMPWSELHRLFKNKNWIHETDEFEEVEEERTEEEEEVEEEVEEVEEEEIEEEEEEIEEEEVEEEEVEEEEPEPKKPVFKKSDKKKKLVQAGAFDTTKEAIQRMKSKPE